MMKTTIIRLSYGFLFAIPLMLVTFALAQASNQPQTTPTPGLNCAECHQAFQQAWENGAHGRATLDPVFREAWLAQGQPVECLKCHVTGYNPETNTWASEGITCQACHSPIISDHPLAPMSADRSAKLCGECHTETHFEWQVSAHREQGVDCVACHDPHATDLKVENKTLLCATCHRARSSNFAHSAHSQHGLTCADCHLQKLEQGVGEGKGRVDHSFMVELTTCNSCHSYQMHDPVAVHPERPTPTPVVDSLSAVEALGVTPEPIPVSPLGFSILSGLVGMAFGVILAPFLERLSRRYRDGE